MYDEASGLAASPRAWNLCDDLGQVEYVFSDKTGTLTSNCMELKKVSINGIMYGEPIKADMKRKQFLRDSMQAKMLELFNYKYLDKLPSFADPDIPDAINMKNSQSYKIREFFSLLAVCHTVMVEYPDQLKPGKMEYRAQSPDEEALVNAARDVGFACINRSDNKVEIDLLGEKRTYTILNIMEFTSDRKRMSVIIQRPEGDIVLLCKGADSVIFERLDELLRTDLWSKTLEHLEEFGNNGNSILRKGYEHYV
jgi:phospholipid-translocating ATPase